MKKIIFSLFATLLLLSSCHTEEKILYLQDLEAGQILEAAKSEPLKFIPGDKLSIIVTSSNTPQVAQKFNLPIVTLQAGSSTTYAQNQVQLYYVDQEGNVDIPTLGKVKIQGLTRSEAANRIQEILRNGQLRDAVVQVTPYDQYITILGEVARPGKIAFTKDHMTILEAIGQAGDLTIQAQRSKIKVIRQENGEAKSYFVDLRSKELFDSPVYNLQQDDIIYVSPNKIKMGQSTYNENSIKSISTWLSISSVLLSIAILIFN